MKVMSLGTATERSTRLAPQRVRRRALRASLRQGLKRILAVLHQWRRISRDRAELASFDERMLRARSMIKGIGERVVEWLGVAYLWGREQLDSPRFSLLAAEDEAGDVEGEAAITEQRD